MTWPIPPASILVGTVAIITCLDAANAAPLTLAAHRAVYDISLLDSGEGSDIASISGRLVMEFTGSECAGYSSKLRFVTQMEEPGGVRRVTDARSATFESADGRNLDFLNETYAGSVLAEQSEGSASRDSDGITVKLTKPEKKNLEISGPLVFPTDQVGQILESANRGDAFLAMTVYDGSEDGETFFETAGVIGPVSTAANDIGEETAIAEAGLAELRHWPLTLSYFDNSRGDTTPYYVMSFIIYENGIGRSLRIDYGDFTLGGKLTGLELLPVEPCP